MDTGTHGAHLDAEGFGNLVVAHAHDITENDGNTEVRSQVIQRRLQRRVQIGHRVSLLWGHVGARHAFIILRQGLHANLGAVAHHIEEEVGGDAVQPSLESTGLVLVQRAEDAHEGFLRQVFGIVLVTGEAVRQAVDPISMLSH